MEENKAAAPLKKFFTTEEKIRNLEKKVEEYRQRVDQLQDSLIAIYDEDDNSTEEIGVGPNEFTISWMPDNPPRVTQRDREIAIWRSRTRHAVTLYCDEELGLQ